MSDSLLQRLLDTTKKYIFALSQQDEANFFADQEAFDEGRETAEKHYAELQALIKEAEDYLK